MTVTEKYINAQQILFKKEGVAPKSIFVETDGPVKKVHYLEAGRGSPLILVHGGGGSTDQWVNLIRHLQPQFKLYIVDRPGCGLTDSIDYRGVDIQKHAVDFIGSFMKALNIPSADFAANSMGGYWTALFAMKHPDKANRIIFLGAPAGLNLYLPLLVRILGLRGFNNLFWNTVAKPSFKGTRKLYNMLLVADADKLSDEYIQCSYLGSVLPGYKKGWLTLLENVSTMKGFRKEYFIGDKMKGLTHKTLFLWGVKDAFQSAEEGQVIARTMRNSKFVPVNKAGHLPWLDLPDFCASEIRKFLTGDLAANQLRIEDKE